MTYASRNWSAVETTDLVGSEYKLMVTGEVQVTKSNEEPRLSEAAPQGIVQQTLILDLKVEGASDLGGHVVLWKPVSYHRTISAREYKTVALRGEVEEQSLEVERALS